MGEQALRRELRKRDIAVLEEAARILMRHDLSLVNSIDGIIRRLKEAQRGWSRH